MDRAEQDCGWVANVKDRALQTVMGFRVSLRAFRASLRVFGSFYGFSEVYGFLDTRKMLNKGFVCSQGTTTYPGGDVCGGAEWHTPQ
jgi:hypothetical protein